VEDDRRLVLILEKELRQDVEEDGRGDEECESKEDDVYGRVSRQAVSQRTGHSFDHAHLQSGFGAEKQEK